MESRSLREILDLDTHAQDFPTPELGSFMLVYEVEGIRYSLAAVFAALEAAEDEALGLLRAHEGSVQGDYNISSRNGGGGFEVKDMSRFPEAVRVQYFSDLFDKESLKTYPELDADTAATLYLFDFASHVATHQEELSESLAAAIAFITRGNPGWSHSDFQRVLSRAAADDFEAYRGVDSGRTLRNILYPLLLRLCSHEGKSFEDFGLGV